MDRMSRRSFFRGAGAVAAVVVVAPGCERPTPPPGCLRPPYSFFDADDATFMHPEGLMVGSITGVTTRWWSARSREPTTRITTMAATVERIDVGTARQIVTSGQGLLVCAYEDDAKCRKGRLESSMPFARFETMAATLPKSQQIIFYCG